MSKLNGCGCLICRKGLSDIVSDLKATHTPREIVNLLGTDHGFKTNVSALSRHLEKVGESALPTRLEETLNPISGSLAISLNEINFDRYNFNPDDAASIISYLQKSHLGIYLSQMEIVYSEVENYRLGETDSQPTASINALQKLHTMLMDLTGIKSIIDVNTAMETLTRLGYEVKKKDAV